MKKKFGKALVVGAGIGGLRAALDLAETGHGVTLIDRAPHLGGILSQLDHQFPTNHCGMCKMLPLFERDAGSQYCLRKGFFHENVEVMLGTELVSLEGEPGRFQALLRRKPSQVDPERCVGCGDCEPVCPVEVPDRFNAGLTSRKAIYAPVPHNYPRTFIIDPLACTACGECEKVCPTGAVRLDVRAYEDFRVLVVDDELIVRDSIKEILDDEGFETDMAASGAEALERLEAENFDLMLLDIKMPGLDGIEVLRLAKEAHPDLNVVMMTAYATVETAVEAMKIGALDYLIKPFEPGALVPMVRKIYFDHQEATGPRLEVGAVILAGGSDYFDPIGGHNNYGYGLSPDVVTHLEFERLLSGTGPTGGSLVRPSDGRPVRKAAWIQCVGSRNARTGADFCSSICCMSAVKEALLARDQAEGEFEAAIFYIDMRTFGKPFQRYRDQAESEAGVRFERAMVHTVNPDPATGDLRIAYIDSEGGIHEENFDMVVLSVGMRPADGLEALAGVVGLELDRWGFPQTRPFIPAGTSREGVFMAGAFSALKDVSESVIQAGAAALSAATAIRASGGGLAMEPETGVALRDASREAPRVLAVICDCGQALSDFDRDRVLRHIETDPALVDLVFIDQACAETGRARLVEEAEQKGANRLLIGACPTYRQSEAFRRLGQETGLDASLIEVVDVRPALFPGADLSDREGTLGRILAMALTRIRRADPTPPAETRVARRALVVGGGIAGMTAALAIADQGYPVDLVERDEALGGNLAWLRRVPEGSSPVELLERTIQNIERHPHVTVRAGTEIVAAYGQAGRFLTTVRNREGEVETLEHGVTILATGGREASTSEYAHGAAERVVTQMELEMKLDDGSIDPAALKNVVMIQCVGSREEPRNYCSRVCCPGALKHALHIKELNPETSIYVFYRDMMTPGFMETYYADARRAGVVFIPYRTDRKPRVEPDENGLRLTGFEPMIGRPIEIEADLVVLGTGVVPNLPEELAGFFGARIDRDGFFDPAEFKWRPVDALSEGVFGCGLALSPRSVTESMASARAAASRALRLLSSERLSPGRVSARVRHSLCSLCQRCIDACPYGARIMDLDLERIVINPIMCQGCGACAAVCPNSASVLAGFTDQQMLDLIDAALDGVAA